MSATRFITLVRNAAVLLLAQFSCYSAIAVEDVFSNSNVLYFDAGPRGSGIAANAFVLSRETEYSSDLGYGWLTAPENSFSRTQLFRSRSELTIDGVVGPVLELRIDLVPGDWVVTCWFEVDPLEEIRTQISLQGSRCDLGWQIFPASAEPREPQPKIYRIFQTDTTVKSEGLKLKLEGNGSPVRLLAVSLIRQSRVTKVERATFLNTFSNYNQLHEGEDLAELVNLTESQVREHKNEGFYTLWHQRLGWLELAEKYASMRGWQWADEQTGLGIFDRYHQAVMLLDGFLAGAAKDQQPLVDRAMCLRARILYWLHKERGGEEVLAGAQRDLDLLSMRYPNDELIRMYRGERIPTLQKCELERPSASAPAWSLAQREALCHMREIVRWWTEHQAPNGEFGGKLGDDVELLRWWTPLCLSGDKNALRGWQKLADGVWHSEQVEDGYSRKVSDVEHASEFISDTAPLMAVYSDAPEYLDRLGVSVGKFEGLWTGINPQGNRHFRSAWFSSTEVETPEPKNRDVEMNTRAARALRFLAWRRPEPHCTKLLHEWSRAWVDAALRSDKQKPQGIIPASVRFDDGAFNGSGPNWYEANMYWTYFDWEHNAGSLMFDQLLFTYFLTGDRQLLEPMLVTLQLLKNEEQSSASKEFAPGSRKWTVQILRECTLFWNVVEQWRFMSGDSRFDSLILKYGSPYGQYRLSGDQEFLIAGLTALLQELLYNTPLKTSEAYFTDRVYVKNWELLKAMLTGDGILNSTSPYFQVTWQNTDEDFTALVDRADSNDLALQLFSHAAEERIVSMRVWQLRPGMYSLRKEIAGIPTTRRTIEIAVRGEALPISLPPQRLLRVSLSGLTE